MNLSSEVKILVTGADGFLGKHVVMELIRQGYNPTIAIERKSSIFPTLKTLFLDITDSKKVMKVVKDFDVVYHLAGMVRTPATDNKHLHMAINAKGTLNMLKACAKHHIKRFIFISSVEVYGEASRLNIKESAVKTPINHYAASKLKAENYCREYAKKYGIRITIIRPSYIYGYGQHSSRIFSKLIYDAVIKKETSLKSMLSGNDFIYVKDVARGIILLGQRRQRNSTEIYNLASGVFTPMEEVFKIVSSITGCQYKSGEKGKILKKVSFSVQKAKKAGYNPLFSLKRGLQEYINYQQSETI